MCFLCKIFGDVELFICFVSKIFQFCTNIKAWLQHVFSLYLDLNPVNVMFDILEKRIDIFTPKHHNYCCKEIHFDCSRESNIPNVNGFQMYLQNIYADEEYIAQ